MEASGWWAIFPGSPEQGEVRPRAWHGSELPLHRAAQPGPWAACPGRGRTLTVAPLASTHQTAGALTRHDNLSVPQVSWW